MFSTVHGELKVVDDIPGAFAEEVIAAYANRPEDLFSFALSGGSTARPCYERLAEEKVYLEDQIRTDNRFEEIVGQSRVRDWYCAWSSHIIPSS